MLGRKILGTLGQGEPGTAHPGPGNAREEAPGPGNSQGTDILVQKDPLCMRVRAWELVLGHKDVQELLAQTLAP